MMLHVGFYIFLWVLRERVSSNSTMGSVFGTFLARWSILEDVGIYHDQDCNIRALNCLSIAAGEVICKLSWSEGSHCAEKLSN